MDKRKSPPVPAPAGDHIKARRRACTRLVLSALAGVAGGLLAPVLYIIAATAVHALLKVIR